MVRRSRKDLTYIATGYQLHHRDLSGAVQTRNERLVEHGWLTSDHRLTNDGERIAKVSLDLYEVCELDLAIDVVGGLPKFVDIVTTLPPDESLDYFRGLMTLGNRVDEAMNQADTHSDEWEHDGLFTPFFMEFKPKKRETIMVFKNTETAREFHNEWVPDSMESRFWDDEYATIVEITHPMGGDE